MTVYLRQAFSLVLAFLLLACMSVAQENPNVTPKLKTICKDFLDAWAKHDFKKATKLTSEDFFYCNESGPIRLDSKDKKVSVLEQIRKNSSIGDTKTVKIIKWPDIRAVSKLPFDKMRLDDKAKKLLRRLTKPSDFSIGVVFENSETSTPDAMLVFCRRDVDAYKIVGIIYDEPRRSK